MTQIGDSQIHHPFDFLLDLSSKRRAILPEVCCQKVGGDAELNILAGC